MRPHATRLSALILILGLINIPTERITPTAKPITTWEVFASGLNNPRGLQFGSDGALYVAEGGVGGTKTTTAQDCQQVPAPSGPYRSGMTARISKIDTDGTRSTVIDGLPSTQTAPQSGSDVSGVSAVAFLDDTLYAVTAGAGCSHGNQDSVNALLRISDGSATQVADISSFLKANPTKTIDNEDFEPDGDIYSMIQVDGTFYIIEANHGELDAITPDGKITRIVDISANQGHVVPTALAYHDGNFYVGTLSIFPVSVGTARLYKITPRGDLTVLAAHLSAVLGVAFDKQGQMYALETSTVDHAYPTAHTGDIVRVNPDAEKAEVVVSGLTFPTAMIFGPDDKLYVSNFGFGGRPGTGQIIRVSVAGN